MEFASFIPLKNFPVMFMTMMIYTCEYDIGAMSSICISSFIIIISAMIAAPYSDVLYAYNI